MYFALKLALIAWSRLENSARILNSKAQSLIKLILKYLYWGSIIRAGSVSNLNSILGEAILVSAEVDNKSNKEVRITSALLYQVKLKFLFIGMVVF